MKDELRSPFCPEAMVSRQRFAALHPGFAKWLQGRSNLEVREQRRKQR